MISKCATIVLGCVLITTCSLSRVENTVDGLVFASTSPSPDPRFKSAAGDPKLRAAREDGTYSAVLQSLIEVDSLIHIGRSTIGIPDVSSLQSKLDRETIHDFISTNASIAQLSRRFDVYSKVRLVDVKQPLDWLEEMSRNGLSNDGLLLMSKVGINDTGSKAVVYVEHYRPKGKVDRLFCVVNRDPLDGVDVQCFPLIREKS